MLTDLATYMFPLVAPWLAGLIATRYLPVTKPLVTKAVARLIGDHHS
jgi:hypothetical protein